MTFLKELHKPDILDCIAHLSSDEVFTPPKLVNEMLDMLPPELFRSTETKFLDPGCKSGVFLREIAKRLIEGEKELIPDLEKRIRHIFTNQLYGLAITELTGLLARRSTYCSKKADGEYSICTFSTPDGNIDYTRTEHVWENGKCTLCGASQSQYDRGDILETHAYSFIHCNEEHNKTLFKRLRDMKFDVIIGNPPYQLSDGGAQASASPIYQLFVEQAKRINPRYITMIIPARWYSGGKNLDKFRDEMLQDDRIRELHDFSLSADCFPGGVGIEGGICYFLWNRDNRGLCTVYTHKGNEITSILTRSLREEGCSSFIRQNEAITILHKVLRTSPESFSEYVHPAMTFGFRTFFKDYKNTKKIYAPVKIYANGGSGYVTKSQIEKGQEYIDKYKVFVSEAYGYGSKVVFPHQIINKPFLGEKNTCCTETYLMIGPYEDEMTTKNVITYMKTRFFRFFVMLKKNTQHATRSVYSFVPVQDFTQEWTDAKLYKKYGLTKEEINFIESMIKPME